MQTHSTPHYIPPLDAASRGAVLVTGAGSGIGWALCEQLSALGVRVLAGARRPEHLKALAGLPGVTPVSLDVRDAAAIDRAAAQWQAEALPLYGVVNNAGLGDLGFLSAWSDADLREIFEVNVFGPHRLTRAMLPLLQAQQGRVVNIGSQGGMLASQVFGPYTMTKHAIEAFTQALQQELQPHGMWASVVQPGGVQTPMAAGVSAATRARFLATPAPWQDDAAAWLEGLSQRPEPDWDAPESAQNRKPSPPALVCDAVLEALYSDRPKLRYMVGTAWEGQRVLNGLLDRLLDANQCPSLQLDAAQLAQLLAERIAARQ